MSLIQHLKHSWAWNRHYYAFSMGLTIIAGVFYYTDYGVFDVIGYPLILFALVFSFISFQKDHFSLKYLQSLPLSKKELYHLKLADNLLALSPLLFWGIVFLPLVIKTLTDKEQVTLEGSIFFILLFLLIAFAVSIYSFSRLYEASRAPFVKGNPKIYNLIMLRRTIYYFALAIYGLYFAGTVRYLLEGWAPQFMLDFFAAVAPLSSSRGILLIIAAIVWFEYHRIFRRWMEEKRSYIKFNWKPLRDVPLMALALISILLPPAYMFSLAQDSYGTSDFMEAVKSGKTSEVDKFLKRGVDINSRTKKGYTALMAAAHLGDEKMYFYLLSKKASKVGVVGKFHQFNGKDISWLAVSGGNLAIVKDLLKREFVNRPYNGSNYLHLAASRCRPGVIDYLLELGANPNVKITDGKKHLGKTPLHIATERACFNGVISLIEAGADLKEKDQSGKIALDYRKSYSQDLNYYLDKKSRSPAGK